MPRRALILGVTGQDGVYLAEALLREGAAVVGTHTGTGGTRSGAALAHLAAVAAATATPLDTRVLDVREADSLTALLQAIAPDEVYNLAAQSSVAASLRDPAASWAVTAKPATVILDWLRRSGADCRLLQPSTARFLCGAGRSALDETAPTQPDSPYAVAKLYAHRMVQWYRREHGVFAATAILFNHESPWRSETFVTRKIARGLADRVRGHREPLRLGNLESRRDWGHAADAADAMVRILRHTEPDDFVVATGATHSVREFVDAAAQAAGLAIRWEGHGRAQRGFDAADGTVLVEVADAFYREEPEQPPGDATRARERLGWRPRVTFDALAAELVRTELA